MTYVIYGFAGLFVLLSITMVIAYFREKHVGLFLMGVVYGTSGLLAIQLMHWWPLIAGFLLAWTLRFLGLEPKVEPKVEPKAEGEEGQT
jgi:hypothetical protein